MYKSIAIDGPCAAGKTTLAKCLAKHLGFTYVNTGSLYRAIAVLYLKDSTKTVSEILKDFHVEFNGDEVIVNGSTIPEHVLRAPETARAASDLSAMPEVREALLDIQRGYAERADVVMEGRDIGTVILPHATMKLFLTATEKKRAMRRTMQLYPNDWDNWDNKELQAKVLQSIHERDENDSHREVAPLRKAYDAVILDNTVLDIPDTLYKALDIWERKVAYKFKEGDSVRVRDGDLEGYIIEVKKNRVYVVRLSDEECAWNDEYSEDDLEPITPNH